MARTIKYAPQRQALYRPEEDATVLTPDAKPPLDALCAEMSRLAYRRFEKPGQDRAYVERAVAGAGYGDTAFFSVGSSQAFATCNPENRTAIVAFRGTQSDDVGDLIADARFHPVNWQAGGKVHNGFADAVGELLAAGLRSWLRQQANSARVYTGHSLGAALATLAASAEPSRDLVTFGSPRVGDESFGRTLAGVLIRRYVDCCDVVARVPPACEAYHHVGAMRYIDRHGMVGNLVNLDAIRHDQDRARLTYLRDCAFMAENVAIRDLADHAPANYVYALFATPADAGT